MTSATSNIPLSARDFQRQLEAALFDRAQRPLLGASCGAADRADPVRQGSAGATVAGAGLAALMLGLAMALLFGLVATTAGFGAQLPALLLALAALLMLLLAAEGGGGLFALLATANLLLTATALHAAPASGGMLPFALLHWLLAATSLLDVSARAPLLRVWLGVELVALAVSAWSLQ